jgi:hypothetical protein
MQQMGIEQKGKMWLGMTPVIPTGPKSYFTGLLEDECLNPKGINCANFERRSDLDYAKKMGINYFVTDDMLFTREFLKAYNIPTTTD